jgi:acyl-CoA thioesterase-2
MTREARAPTQYIWLKPNGVLPDDPGIHLSMLAYASDFTLLDTALIAHGKLLFDPDMQLASLDHALWFHRPLHWDDWVLYAQDSPSAAGSRGLCRGSLYTRDGLLIASTAQEGLMRQRQTADLVK